MSELAPPLCVSIRAYVFDCGPASRRPEPLWLSILKAFTPSDGPKKAQPSKLIMLDLCPLQGSPVRVVLTPAAMIMLRDRAEHLCRVEGWKE